MAINVLFNGVVYSIPQTGEEGWGDGLTSYFTAIPQGVLQKSGGSFPLTADLDFGANYGLLSKYFRTRTALPSSSGILRLSISDSIGWRNNANNLDLLLAVNGSDQLTFNGVVLQTTGSFITALTGDVTATGPGSTTATIAAGAITDAKIAAGAGISRTKLAAGTNYRMLANDSSGNMSENAALTPSKVVLSDANGQLSTGTPSIAQGGTGQTSASAAFNALSPITTKGDLIVGNGANSATRLPIGSDGQVPVGDSTQFGGIRWATLQQGSKNYIAQSSFENNSTTGWSLFNTTLTSGIPTGSITAGASSITIFGVTSTTPLAGTYSLNVGNTAGGITAGHGFISDVFNIDNEDQARILAQKFFYGVVSGAANLSFSANSSSTWAVYWYDVSNSKWVQGSGVYNFTGNLSKGNAPCTGTVQLDSTCTQARLAIICINATTNPSSMLFDDFSVGPQVSVSAPAMSDWQVGTFTLGAVTTAPSLGGTTTQVRRWRRDGDSASYTFETDSTVAGSAGSGIYLWPLPAGQSIDTTKVVTYSSVSSLSKATVLGSGLINFKQLSNATAPVIVFAYDANNLMIAAGDGNSADSTAGIQFTPISSTWNQTSGTGGVTYDFQANHVPIIGWSSNTVSSADNDTRVIALNVSNPTGAPSTSFSTVVYGSVSKDSSGSYNPSTGIYTVCCPGWYSVTASCLIQSTSYASSNENQIEILLNGSTTQAIGTAYWFGSTASSNLQTQVASVNWYNVGDTIQIKAFSNSSGTLSWVGASAYNVLSIFRLTGPAVVQASESVNASYTFTNAGAFPNNVLTSLSNNYVTYSKLWDTHNEFNTTSGSYVCPGSGKFNFDAMVQFPSLASGAYWIAVVQSGSVSRTVTLAFSAAPSTSNSNVLNGSAEFNCLAGDTLTLQALQSSGSTSAISNSGAQWNHIDITRVGN